MISKVIVKKKKKLMDNTVLVYIIYTRPTDLRMTNYLQIK